MCPEDPSLPVTGFSPSGHVRGFEALVESFHDGKGRQELSFDGTCWKPTQQKGMITRQPQDGTYEDHVISYLTDEASISAIPSHPWPPPCRRSQYFTASSSSSNTCNRRGLWFKRIQRKQFRENLQKAGHQGSATKYKHVYKRNICTDRRAHHSECTLSRRKIRTIQCKLNSPFCSWFLAQRYHIQDFGYSNAAFIGILG